MLIIDADGPRVFVQEGGEGYLIELDEYGLRMRYHNRITFGPTEAQPDHPGLRYVDQ
jgi:hypothetical protein